MLRAVVLAAFLTVALARAARQTPPEPVRLVNPAVDRTCASSGEKCDSFAGLTFDTPKPCCDAGFVCSKMLGVSSTGFGE
jgi:hypothetical protein